LPAGHQPLEGKGSIAQAAARDVNFNLTEEGDRLPRYKTLRGLLGSLGKSSFGSHDTPYLATASEAKVGAALRVRGRAQHRRHETLKNSMMRTATSTVRWTWSTAT